jgi:2-amino-4-hydroxy-6-hydroxymethyldihydropteridine diphosphokinase
VAGLVEVAIALGSNLGDRREHLEFAVSRLSTLLNGLRVSSFRETEPFDVAEPQPRYLNAVAIGATTLDPDALLAALMNIEQARGRTRLSTRAPRTLDLDLILFADRVIERHGLTVPHPRFRERLFVLEPLAELAPAWTDPVSGRTARELLAVLKRS